MTGVCQQVGPTGQKQGPEGVREAKEAKKGHLCGEGTEPLSLEAPVSLNSGHKRHGISIDSGESSQQKTREHPASLRHGTHGQGQPLTPQLFCSGSGGWSLGLRAATNQCLTTVTMAAEGWEERLPRTPNTSSQDSSNWGLENASNYSSNPKAELLTQWTFYPFFSRVEAETRIQSCLQLAYSRVLI